MVHGKKVPTFAIKSTRHAQVIWMDYDGRTPSEITVRRGDRFRVVQRDSSGWTLIQLDDREGWIPDLCAQLL